MLQMMKVRNVTRTRKMRVVRKTRRVRGLAELTVGSGGGTDQQVTVHTRVSFMAEVLIICVWGRLARSGTTSEWRGRAGGADFLRSSSRAVSAACVCTGGAAKAAEPFKLLAQNQMSVNAHEHTGMWTGVCLRMEHKRCGFTCRSRGCHGQGLPGLFVSRQGLCMPPSAFCPHLDTQAPLSCRTSSPPSGVTAQSKPRASLVSHSPPPVITDFFKIQAQKSRNQCPCTGLQICPSHSSSAQVPGKEQTPGAGVEALPWQLTGICGSGA